VVLRPQLAPTLGPFPSGMKKAASVGGLFETGGQARP